LALNFSLRTASLPPEAVGELSTVDVGINFTVTVVPVTPGIGLFIDVQIAWTDWSATTSLGQVNMI